MNLGLILRVGVARGLSSLRLVLVRPQDIITMILPPAIMCVALWVYRDSQLMGVPVPVAGLPGLLTLQVTMICFSGVLTSLLVERYDGTVQRLRTLPQGLAIYAVGQTIHQTLSTLLGSALLLPVFFFSSGFQVNILLLIAALITGLLLCTTWGLLLGSIVRSGSSSISAAMTPFVVMIIFSGLVVPMIMTPAWMQTVGSYSPLFWLGQLFREAMLPASGGVLEIGGKFEPEIAALNVSVWMLVGLVLTPIFLNRLTRRAVGGGRHEGRQKAVPDGNTPALGEGIR